jgi:alpha-tubulin suppressor-like RCC1 family protein
MGDHMAHLGSWRRALRPAAVAAAVLGGVTGGAVALPSAASADLVHIVYAWGDNRDGQAGVGPVGDSRLRPVPVAGTATNVVQLDGSGSFSMSLRADGTVWAWGNNTYKQLGDGTTQNSFAPVQARNLPPAIVQVSAGGTHAVALAADGSVWTWGDNRDGQLGYAASTGLPARVPGLTDVKQVSAGGSFTLALRSNGEVWSWGAGGSGQLGDGTHTARRSTPARNKAVYGITQISAGGHFGLARRPGSVWAWGDNFMGQLGNGSTVTDSATPVIVDRHTQNATQVVAGGDHAFAVDPDGSVWAWGNNTFGALGIGVVDDPHGPFSHGRNVPLHLSLTGVTQLAAGGEENLALRSDGTLLAWGMDLFGLLGNGTQNTGNVAAPTPVTAVSGVTQIGLGGFTPLVVASAQAMPAVIGEFGSTALAVLQEIGLAVQVVTVPDDPLCNNVGLVTAQNPPAGTVVQPGQQVAIHVLGPPPGGCF